MTKARATHRESYHHGDLRNALLQAAERLVARHGPEGFSLREAARDVGVSPAAAYRHFADKTALLTALAVEGHAQLAIAMEKAKGRVPAGGTPEARAVAGLVAIGEGYVEFAVRHPSQFRVMFGPALSVECFQVQAPSGADPYQILTDTLDALVTARAIKPDRRAGAELVAWSSVHGLASLVVGGALPLPAQQLPALARLLGRNILLGLGCDPALAPRAPALPDLDPRQACPEHARR